jgi:hypothetical protein
MTSLLEAVESRLKPPPAAGGPETSAVGSTLLSKGESRLAQPQNPGFIDKAANVVRGLGNEMSAAMQMTSPVTETMQGQPTKKLLGEMAVLDSGPSFKLPDGKYRSVDPGMHVILTDPKTRKTMVYERGESPGGIGARLDAGGRLLSLGMIDTVRGVTQAGKAGMAAADLAEDFASQGVRVPTVGTVTQGRSALIAEEALRNMPGSAGTMHGAQDRAVVDAGRAAERLAGQYGDATTPFGSGDTIKSGLRNHIENFKAAANDRYGALDAKIGGDTRVPVDGIKSYLDAEAAKYADDPEFAELLQSPRLRAIQAAVSKKEDVPYVLIKNLRTDIGKKLAKPTAAPDEDRALLEGLYSALTDDMKTAASNAGAIDEFTDANNFYRQGIDQIRGSFDLMLRRTEEALFFDLEKMAAEKGAKASSKALVDLRSALDPKDWDQAVSVLVRRLGKPTPGAVDALAAESFSPATFITNYEKLAPVSRSILFGVPDTPKRKAMDQLVRVVGSLKNAQKTRQSPNTAPTLGTTGLLGYTALTGDIVTPALTAVGANVAARLMTFPPFINLYAATVRGAGPDTVARLSQFSRQYPQHASELRALSDALAQEPEEPTGTQ